MIVSVTWDMVTTAVRVYNVSPETLSKTRYRTMAVQNAMNVEESTEMQNGSRRCARQHQTRNAFHVLHAPQTNTYSRNANVFPIQFVITVLRVHTLAMS